MLGEDAIDILCDAGRKSSWRLVLIVGGSAMDIVFDSGLPSGLTWGEKAIDILLRVRKGGRDPSLLEAIEALERESFSNLGCWGLNFRGFASGVSGNNAVLALFPSPSLPFPLTLLYLPSFPPSWS
eukprot:2145178-Rhodomonas_salina.1